MPVPPGVLVQDEAKLSPKRMIFAPKVSFPLPALTLCVETLSMLRLVCEDNRPIMLAQGLIDVYLAIICIEKAL